MEDWQIKITSARCPYKVYPTHTKNKAWEKGYCNLTLQEKKCSKENCIRILH